MKRITFLSVIILFVSLTSCVSYSQIGEVNMISHRNIDNSQKYVLLQTYVGATDEERKQSRATTVQQAVDETVQKVSGGEYLMNVRIFLVTKGVGKNQKTFFAVEGDVWGIKTASAIEAPPTSIMINGFKSGDKVTIKSNGKYYTGVIIAVKEKTALVKWDDNQETEEIKYKELTKIQ